jgi:hypothetical protein
MADVTPMHTLWMRGNLLGLKAGAEAAALSRLPSESPRREVPRVDISASCDSPGRMFSLSFNAAATAGGRFGAAGHTHTHTRGNTRTKRPCFRALIKTFRFCHIWPHLVTCATATKHWSQSRALRCRGPIRMLREFSLGWPIFHQKLSY